MKNKIVIYTCRTGNYDNLMQPMVVDNSFDYICFTDNLKKHQQGIWIFREIPKTINDNQKLSRYPKMFPHILLSEYEYSVYIDANILIQNQSFYDYIKDAINNNYDLAGIKHPFRKCVYDEFFIVFYTLKEINLRKLKDEYLYLKANGFPRNYGMYEANIIFRKHCAKNVIRQCEEWWSLYLEFTRRDQLSYPYTLWKNGLSFIYLMPTCGIYAGSHEAYKVNLHSTHLTTIKKILYLLFSLIPQQFVKKLFYYYLSH